MFRNYIFNIFIKKDLALNDLQGSICLKTKPNQTKTKLKHTGVCKMFEFDWNI